HGVGLAGGQLAFVDAEARRARRVVGGAEDAAAARVRVGGDGHVLEDFFLVPDVVAGGDDMRAHVEDLLGNRGRYAKAAGGVLAVDDEEIDGVGLHDVRQMIADDAAAGRANDVPYKKGIHTRRLARWGSGSQRDRVGGRRSGKHLD